MVLGDARPARPVPPLLGGIWFSETYLTDVRFIYKRTNQKVGAGLTDVSMRAIFRPPYLTGAVFLCLWIT